MPPPVPVSASPAVLWKNSGRVSRSIRVDEHPAAEDLGAAAEADRERHRERGDVGEALTVVDVRPVERDRPLACAGAPRPSARTRCRWCRDRVVMGRSPSSSGSGWRGRRRRLGGRCAGGRLSNAGRSDAQRVQRRNCEQSSHEVSCSCLLCPKFEEGRACFDRLCQLNRDSRWGQHAIVVPDPAASQRKHNAVAGA